MPLNESLDRKLRFALVGGGQGSFIGRVHSIAAQLDGRADLVAGADVLLQTMLALDGGADT